MVYYCFTHITIHSHPFTSIHHIFGDECCRVFDPSYPPSVWQDMNYYTPKTTVEHLRVVGTSSVHARINSPMHAVLLLVLAREHSLVARYIWPLFFDYTFLYFVKVISDCELLLSFCTGSLHLRPLSYFIVHLFFLKIEPTGELGNCFLVGFTTLDMLCFGVINCPGGFL